jgi:hypothetical protein
MFDLADVRLDLELGVGELHTGALRAARLGACVHRADRELLVPAEREVKAEVGAVEAGDRAEPLPLELHQVRELAKVLAQALPPCGEVEALSSELQAIHGAAVLLPLKP